MTILCHSLLDQIFLSHSPPKISPIKYSSKVPTKSQILDAFFKDSIFHEPFRKHGLKTEFVSQKEKLCDRTSTKNIHYHTNFPFLEWVTCDPTQYSNTWDRKPWKSPILTEWIDNWTYWEPIIYNCTRKKFLTELPLIKAQENAFL